MDTTLVPMNVAQFQNSLTYMGDWMTPFFSALWPLAAIVVAIALVAVILAFLGDIFVWLAEWITNINFFNIRNHYDIKNDYNIANRYNSLTGSTPRTTPAGIYTLKDGTRITGDGKIIK